MIRAAALFIIGFAALILSASAHAAVSFDVARVDKITIDGDDADWGERGLRVEFLTSTTGRLFAEKDCSARARIGWDDGGLLVFVRISDDVRDENPNAEPLGRNDSTEVFLSDGVGSPQSYQFTVAAGAPGGKSRSAVTDRRATKTPPAKIEPELAARAFDGGYVLEMRLPWPEQNPPRKAGDSVGFQLRVNDTDKGPRKALLWFPRADTYTNPESMHRLVLAEKSSPPVRLAAQGDYDAGLSRADVTVTALPELSGKDVSIRGGTGDKVLGHDTLGPVGEDGVAVAHPRLPMAPRGQTYGPLAVIVDGIAVATLQLPDADDTRARRLMTLPVVFQPGNYFTAPEFPAGDFEQPLVAQQIIGPYAIHTTFYDEAYHIVTQAAKPGRYGAVIEFVPDAGGRTIRRFRTIFRAAKDLRLWQVKTRLSVDDPREAGLDPDTTAVADEMLGDFASQLLDSAVSHDDPLPAVLATLSTSRPSSDASPWRRNNDGFAQDRQWWVGLKRKLNGWNQRWPDGFTAPRPIDGPLATELRVGTAKDAGLTEAGLARLEQVCADWARDGGEGFDVCIARHGVIGFNKPFGQRRGHAMTLDEKSRVASVTKIFSGTAMMMLVDQGVVSLDDPVSKFLPAFTPTGGKTPLTIRHLYTHTSGLSDLWVEEASADYDQIIGEYAPRLQVGRKFAYQGVSQGVGGKILEAVTGEALPTFYLKHLLQPLGMDHTDVATSASGAYSTSLDLAKLGQMLLNRGAYGSMRFMKPQTLDAMMSQPLTKVLGPDTTIKYGIGISAYADSVFGPRTFGHGSASSTIFRVSPDRDMVVMAARNAEGQRYYEYEAKFFQAIADALVDEEHSGGTTKPR